MTPQLIEALGMFVVLPICGAAVFWKILDSYNQSATYEDPYRRIATLLDEAAIHKMLTPLYMSVELLPLGLFTEDHAEMIAKLINLMAVDSAGKGNGMWQIADAVGQVLIAMQARVDEGKSWNVTATERETLVENIMKMDKHFRTWTVRRFNINAMAVNEINNRAKAQGAKRGQRVEIQL